MFDVYVDVVWVIDELVECCMYVFGDLYVVCIVCELVCL